ncbi:MAG: HAMP domain-containing histidine kinase [Actinomycetota bacterium]|nr:HAMP domain-containing histidine kinase [Actinomycetota bacterium]MDQ2955886.1 HAMP domain-containing histidine kinase [Actinomycetota bacterium]
MTQPFQITDSEPSYPGAGTTGAEPPGPDTQAPPPKRLRQWLRGFQPKTLTARLAIGVVLLVAVLSSVTATVTYLSLRSFLYNQLDQQVSASAAANANSIRQSFANPDSGNQINLVFTGERLWLNLINSDGSVPQIFIKPTQRNEFAVLDLPADRAQRFIAHTNKIMTVESGGEPLHAQSVAVNDGNFVVIGLSTRQVGRTLHRLVLLELVIGGAVIAIAAILTSWGVRVGLRPLRRVTRTAQEVTAELGPDGSGLERRVPVNGASIEVEEVATSVNTLLHAVETEFAARVRSEERMRQFLADASHELRTPLTSIRGYAELARLRGESTDSPDDSMHRIEVEGTRMSRLVEDLLVLARGDQGTITHREPVQVDQLLSEAVSAVHSAHPDREFSIALSGGMVVIGDHDQLLRVLINLATNAAIHTPPDGPIRLEAIAGRTPLGAAVALRVIDAGPGLPADEAAHVFERFWRADKARSRAKGGSGLGMAIVAQIVAAHGGTVQFESSVQAGTTVTVTLQLPRPGPYPPAASPPALAAGQPGQLPPAGYAQTGYPQAPATYPQAPATYPQAPATYPPEQPTRQN